MEQDPEDESAQDEDAEYGVAGENVTTVEWDVDGRGTGEYWMRKDWDGHVEGTHDWTRLNNVTTQ